MKNCNKINELLKENNVLVAEHTEIFEIPYPSEVFDGFQGGCSDGDGYYYQVLMHYEMSDRTKDYSCIAKIDLKEKKVVKYSDVMHVDHGNDIAYNKEKNLLFVVNNRPNPTKITLVDPETLEVVGYRETPVPIYALEYIESKKMYAAGISGTRDFCFFDEELNLVGEIHTCDPSTNRYTKQGMCADENLIYFILWDGKHKDMDDFQNLIAIYDWSGSFKGVLEFNVGVKEPENLSIVNGEMLAVCGSTKSGPIIYHFEPKIKN